MSEKQTSGFFNPRDRHIIKNYAIAGGAAGLGAAALTSAANYIKYLKKRSQREKDTSFDDDTMYVDVPLDKKAGIGTGVALAGGTMSALLAYMAGRKVYQRVKKKSLQKDLDQAQQMYMTTLSDEAMGKNASSVEEVLKPRRAVGTLETLMSMPVAMSLLTGLASGVVANKTLNHYIPPADAKGKRIKPKKMQVRYTIGGKPIGVSDSVPVDGEEDEEVKKLASMNEEDEVDFIVNEAERRQAVAFLCDISLSMEKSGSFLPDLVYAVADGRIKEIEDNVANFGPSTAMDMIKGASDTDIPLTAQRIAVNLIVGSDVLRDTAAIIASTDIVENCPSFFKIATTLPETDSVAVFKLAAALGAANINESLDQSMGGEEEVEPEDLATTGDEGAYDRLEDIPDGEKQTMSPRKLLEMLLAQEMAKTSQNENKDKTDDEKDLIDHMLTQS